MVGIISVSVDKKNALKIAEHRAINLAKVLLSSLKEHESPHLCINLFDSSSSLAASYMDQFKACFMNVQENVAFPSCAMSQVQIQRVCSCGR